MLLLISCSALSENDKPPSYSRNVEEWIEVSGLIYEEIATDPWFSNACLWSVHLDGEVVFADPLVLGSEIPHLKLSEKQNIVGPGSIIKVPDGWLAAYYNESTREVYWFSNDKLQKQLLRDAWVTQFCAERTSGDVFAGSDAGILRFWVDKENSKWMSEQIVNFEFGRVFGITPDWNGGFLVFAHSGWWEVSKDRKVTRLESFDDIEVSGVTIAKKGNRVFVGGSFFVSEINLDNHLVRRLCPSHRFLHAMRTLSRNHFLKFLQ